MGIQEMESEEELEPDDQGSMKFKLVSTMGKEAFSHTDIYTIMRAAGLSHQKVLFHKNVRIEDVSGHLPEEIIGNLLSVEISPTVPDKPGLSGILMGDFVENTDYGTLTFQILEDKNKIAPFYLRLDIFHEALIDIKIRSTITNGSTTDFLRLHQYLEKMKNMEYRRFKIINAENVQVLVSSCPNIKDVFTSLEIDIVTKLRELEVKSGRDFGIPPYCRKLFLTSLDKLNESWEGLTDYQRERELAKLSKQQPIVKFTLLKVILKGEQDEVINVMFSEERGWINYNSIGFTPNSTANKVLWQSIAKKHGPFTLISRNRIYKADEFFNALNNKLPEQLLLQAVINLLNQPVNEPVCTKSIITINFKDPVQSGWSNIQHIEIEIKDADPLYNELETYIFASDFVPAIHLLEIYKEDFLEDLAFAYALDGRYEESIVCAEEAIRKDRRSVAHFTKGLAYAGKGDFKSAYSAYHLAVHLCNVASHPVPKENLEKMIHDKQIQTDEVYEKIVKLLSKPRPPMKDNDKCYCHSGRKFKNCHGSY